MRLCGVKHAVPGRPAWLVILAFAATKLALNLYASGFYDYFRDELYFIACGRHLDWGYVDHPPLVALYARIGEMLDPSLRGFRFLATISGTLHIILTGVIAARLGGGKAAQALGARPSASACSRSARMRRPRSAW